MRSVAARPDPYAVLNIPHDADGAAIRAAYRALAWINHPDLNASPDAVERMRELNAAYELVRTEEGRSRHRAARGAPGPVAAPTTPAEAPRADARTLSFGRYAGWTIEQLARHDPDYLRWLSRHSAGQPYRREIADRLGSAARRAAPDRPSPPPRRRWAFFGA